MQYVPLSGLGQPLTSELRQVGLRVNGDIPDVQRETCYLKRQQRQIIVSVATSTLAREVKTHAFRLSANHSDGWISVMSDVLKMKVWQGTCVKVPCCVAWQLCLS